MADTSVHNITSQAAFDAAINEGVAVFDFYATWCGPCKVVAPKIVELSKQYSDAKFYKVDVDDQAQLAASLGIRAMPTFLVYKKGEKVKEIVGADAKAVEQAVAANL